jgi:hypothetical protein
MNYPHEMKSKVSEWRETISNDLFQRLGLLGQLSIDFIFLKTKLQELYQKNEALGKICNIFLFVIIIFEEYFLQSGQHGQK